MADIAEHAWFVHAMVKATTDMWLKGWDERNGGNVSLRLAAEDLAPFAGQLTGERSVSVEGGIPELGGQYFLVTGSGKFFRNIQLDPAATLGLVQLTPDGRQARVLWGYTDGAVPTSELAAHLRSHRIRQQVSGGRDRVIMHCHATNTIALSYVLDASTAVLTRALWEMSTECLVVFPDGIGVLPWIVPGTTEIGEATAAAMREHALVLWPYHGVFSTGPTLDDAFGLIDTAEKAAEILVKVIAMGGKRHSMTTQNLRDLAARFGVHPLPAALEETEWMPPVRGTPR